MIDLYSGAIQALMPCVSRFTRSNFWSCYRQHRRNPVGKLYAPTPLQQLDKVKALLQHAYDHVPFYRERMVGLGLTPQSIKALPDLQKLPPTTKADVNTHFPDRITASDQNTDNWRFVSTSGTTQRMTVVQDFHKRDIVRAAQMLTLDFASGYRAGMKYMEIPPDICQHVCGTSDIPEPNVFRFFFDNLKARRLLEPEVITDLRGLVERQLIYRRIQLPSLSSEGIRQKPETLASYLQEIDGYQPHVLKALPLYLYLLAIYIKAKNLKPPRITGNIMPMGSSMSPYMKQVIESAFERPVSEDYGSSELGGIAAECDLHYGLHPFTGFFHVEVVRQDKPVREGEVGRVLITDLSNYAMPLIRYDIGDVATLLNERCGCGIPGKRLIMHGRAQDCFVREDNTLVTSDCITDLLLQHAGILAFQLEFEDQNAAFLQIVSSGDTPPDIGRVCQALSALLGGGIKTRARLVSTIQPEPGGKYRFVKNLSPALVDVI